MQALAGVFQSKLAWWNEPVNLEATLDVYNGRHNRSLRISKVTHEELLGRLPRIDEITQATAQSVARLLTTLLRQEHAPRLVPSGYVYPHFGWSAGPATTAQILIVPQGLATWESRGKNLEEQEAMCQELSQAIPDTLRPLVRLELVGWNTLAFLADYERAFTLARHHQQRLIELCVHDVRTPDVAGNYRFPCTYIFEAYDRYLSRLAHRYPLRAHPVGCRGYTLFACIAAHIL